MRIYLHIGMDTCGVSRVQKFLDAKRDQLAGKGVLYPIKPGRQNHTRLYMAVSDPENVDVLRWNRGYATAALQANLRMAVIKELAGEVAKSAPTTMILSANQFGSALRTPSELGRLHDILRQFSDDIRIVAHVEEQSRVLMRHYFEQLLAGRTASLKLELGIAGADPQDWAEECIDMMPRLNPLMNEFAEVQAPAFWLDYAGLQKRWEDVFGAGCFSFRSYDPETFYGDDSLAQEVCAAFDLPKNIGKIDAARAPTPAPAPWATRARQMNLLFSKALAKERLIPRQLWRKLLIEVGIGGAPLQAGALSPISNIFKASNAALVQAHPALSAKAMTPDAPLDDWTEANPERGFRATQYMCVFLPRIDAATIEEREKRAAAIEALAAHGAEGPKLSPVAEKLLPPLAKDNYPKLAVGRFAPHNKLGHVEEDTAQSPYPAMTPHELPKGKTGNVIVGCMKNEGPYILEWVAYHRAIGVDNFLIYTNDCSDGTDEILGRLMELGVIEHRLNNDWKGNSPQQYALNQSLKEPVIMNADWIAHIDVDEFMNIRTGNGTLDDLFAAAPDATAWAMTWRLFGHNDVTQFADDLVIGQFDHCAPKYCPKPHTVWGFKTMFRNDGAYEKFSCHRPNKLDPARAADIKWVNGSGKDMGEEVKENGWRSGLGTIGYDLIQLNHYALRSAESYLIKRQRGRALHVDRSIGINYWVRMDWNQHKDVSIQRNIERTRVELDRLLADDVLRDHHARAVDWHRAKAAELHQNPEFETLYEQALETKLDDLERVAFALALDLES
ncbi:hypothetical protein AQS8620_00906 [Aquimixticola soesokkakensis]|uniref:Glycosyl transferase family 2 n=1 Tax=Aquimixticola soesokkakensis TaxID=1519096 RepID=A0A1Y5S460_9RHOB|nr:glycosyltransferase family 2 protein [Aquimixticola soesokkakensis]SLN29388.1 hypothetical protein AQS8620_00906 [Aquimixticola soesokkakensis]